MRGNHRLAIAGSALLALTITVTVVFAENDSDKAAPPAAVPAAPLATPEVTILNKHEVEGVLGREVRSATDEDMGRIVDVLVDHAGEVRAAIIDLSLIHI